MAVSKDHTDRVYLGDGVYASFDGYQIWLAANHHENVVIALEPAVLKRLVGYQNALIEKYSEEVGNDDPMPEKDCK